jgi:hypothetical protein
MAAIVMEGGTKVKTGDGVGCPSTTGVRLFVDIHACAGRGEWGAVVVEGTVDLSIGG